MVICELENGEGCDYGVGLVECIAMAFIPGDGYEEACHEKRTSEERLVRRSVFETVVEGETAATVVGG